MMSYILFYSSHPFRKISIYAALHGDDMKGKKARFLTEIEINVAPELLFEYQ